MQGLANRVSSVKVGGVEKVIRQMKNCFPESVVTQALYQGESQLPEVG